MHSRLIFLHHVLFSMKGRFSEIPAPYGYGVGGTKASGRQIRQAQTKVSPQGDRKIAKGKVRGTKKSF